MLRPMQSQARNSCACHESRTNRHKMIRRSLRFTTFCAVSCYQWWIWNFTSLYITRDASLYVFSWPYIVNCGPQLS